jgi:hypothetical protein
MSGTQEVKVSLTGPLEGAQLAVDPPEVLPPEEESPPEEQAAIDRAEARMSATERTGRMVFLLSGYSGILI